MKSGSNNIKTAHKQLGAAAPELATAPQFTLPQNAANCTSAAVHKPPQNPAIHAATAAAGPVAKSTSGQAGSSRPCAAQSNTVASMGASPNGCVHSSCPSSPRELGIDSWRGYTQRCQQAGLCPTLYAKEGPGQGSKSCQAPGPAGPGRAESTSWALLGFFSPGPAPRDAQAAAAQAAPVLSQRLH